MRILRPLLAVLTLWCAVAGAQTIQRCEGADGRIVYSDSSCPVGTRAVRALPPATQPSAEAQKEARDRLQREKDAAKALAPQQTTGRSESYVTVDEARRASDCAYLRAELDANRRLRNVLTTRPYYSQDDVDEMDARQEKLVADYRRVCTR